MQQPEAGPHSCGVGHCLSRPRPQNTKTNSPHCWRGRQSARLLLPQQHVHCGAGATQKNGCQAGARRPARRRVRPPGGASIFKKGVCVGGGGLHSSSSAHGSSRDGGTCPLERLAALARRHRQCTPSHAQRRAHVQGSHHITCLGHTITIYQAREDQYVGTGEMAAGAEHV